MATRMMTVCDVCGAVATGDTIRLGWGSSFYEADLCADHVEELSSIMDRVVKNAKLLGGSKQVAGSPFVIPTTAPRRKPTTIEVRRWAKQQGLKVPDKGRVPEALISQYTQAQLTPTT